MGETPLEATQGGIVVSFNGRDVVLCVARGHVRRVHVLDAQVEIERRLDAALGGPMKLLFDGSSIDTFDPGLPMLWVAWLRRRTDRLGRIAIVGRPGPMLAVAATFRYLLPSLRFSLFRGRREALAFLRA